MFEDSPGSANRKISLTRMEAAPGDAQGFEPLYTGANSLAGRMMESLKDK
jgi:hypothetical protein